MGSKSLFTVSVNVKSYGLVEVMGLQGYGLRECRLYEEKLSRLSAQVHDHRSHHDRVLSRDHSSFSSWPFEVCAANPGPSQDLFSCLSCFMMSLYRACLYFSVSYIHTSFFIPYLPLLLARACASHLQTQKTVPSLIISTGGPPSSLFAFAISRPPFHVTASRTWGNESPCPGARRCEVWSRLLSEVWIQSLQGTVSCLLAEYLDEKGDCVATNERVS